MQKNFKELKANVALVAISRPWKIENEDGSVAREGMTEDLYIQYRNWKGELSLMRVDVHAPKTEGPKYKAYLRKQLVDIAHLNPFSTDEGSK